ncbi:MAG TPA: ABC transporter substrate-binding protein [Bacillales bacterium]|nr:ABC transporter substrate-binding protein [Bacillales bacterium]
MRKKGFMFVLVLVMSLSALLTGCSGSGGSDTASGSGGNQSSDGKTIVNFWSFWGSETRRPVIQHMVDEFNKSQDKIKVEYTYLPWGDIWTKELASVAAGNPPDVVVQDIMSVPLRASKDQITNLSKYIEKEGDDFGKRFFPQLWDMMDYNGDIYAVPYNTDTRVLFYNKDLFKKAGLDPNDPPETWQELWEYANKLDVKNGDQYETIGFYPLWGVGKDIWLENADGDAYFNSDMKPVINDPTSVEVMNWLKKWNEKYGMDTIHRYDAYFKNSQANPFLTGKLGMYVQAATFYTQIRDYAKDLNFGVTLMPEFKPGSGHTSWGGGFEVEIPKGSKHPDAAWEFIKYLTGKQAQKYWAVHTFDNVANIEAAKAAGDSPKLNDESQMVYKVATESVKNNVVTPYPLKAPNFLDKVNPPLDKALLGQMPVEKALNQAQHAVEQSIKANQ